VTQFPVVDHELVIGGVPLRRLAARVGSTPFYAYDRGLISQRVALLRSCLPREISLRYAVKANPMPAVLSHLRGLVDGFDVSSLKELTAALDTGMSPGNIGLSGPGKTDHLLSCAVAAGVVIDLESERDLAVALAAAEPRRITPRVAVRVNPDFEFKKSSVKMGGGARQFGVDADRVPDLLMRISDSRAEFEGFHVFSGSQNLSVESIDEALTNSLEMVCRLSGSARRPPRSVTLGGGFGIPYFPGDKPLDLAALGGRLEQLVARARDVLPGTRLVLELGRYIVGEAGIYVCRVVDRKLSRGQVFLVTDGGMNHHLAASGNLGQIIRKNYPVAVGNRMGVSDLETASVVGPLCTPLDLLGDKISIPRAEVGDLIVVFLSGAYGLTASPLDFLGHPHPAEVLVRHGGLAFPRDCLLLSSRVVLGQGTGLSCGWRPGRRVERRRELPGLGLFGLFCRPDLDHRLVRHIALIGGGLQPGEGRLRQAQGDRSIGLSASVR
jgi:diaminopimelate decarboxylase